MDSLYHYCQGESHKATNKPCQDCAYAEHSDSLSMAIVSDGHGGARYFRSDRGSRFAVEIAADSLRQFVEAMKEQRLFSGQPFTAYGIDLPVEAQKDKVLNSLKWLMASIISKWNNRIAEDAESTPLTDWERQNVEEKYRNEFEENVGSGNGTFEKTYGCTLMAFVRTPGYWFAFQIGDGKAVFFNVAGGKLAPAQPIPWDERCFLNKTTSICDSDAANEFRFCYEADGSFPIAVFLGSDGIDDTFGDGNLLTDFYIRIFKEIAFKGRDKTLDALKKDLPKISKVGSKDDMSVACVYEDSNMKQNYLIIAEWSLQNLDEQAKTLNDQMAVLKAKIEAYGDEEKLDQNGRINLDYAKKELERAEAKLVKVKNMRHGLKSVAGKLRVQLKSKHLKH